MRVAGDGAVIVTYGVDPAGAMRELAVRHEGAADGVAITGVAPYLSCVEAIVRREHFPRSKFGFVRTQFDFGVGTR